MTPPSAHPDHAELAKRLIDYAGWIENNEMPPYRREAGEAMRQAAAALSGDSAREGENNG